MLFQCLLFDGDAHKECLTTFVEALTVGYNSDIQGMVIRCADSSCLVKKASPDFYKRNMAKVSAMLTQSTALISLENLGAFICFPSGGMFTNYVRANQGRYDKTVASWDTATDVSKMNLT